MDDLASDLEQRAERAVRRGDLLAALDLFERLSGERPEDERIRGRIESVRSLLQPSELVHRRRAEPQGDAAPEDAALTDAELGELHAANGRYPQAVQAYRRAVAAHPGNELLRERLAELFRLAPGGARAVDDGLARAEKLSPAQASSEPPPARAARSSRAADATFLPVPQSAHGADEVTADRFDAPGSLPPAPRKLEPSLAPAPHDGPFGAKLIPAGPPSQPPVPLEELAPVKRDPVEVLRGLLERVRRARRKL